MDTSSFSTTPPVSPDADLLTAEGATCDGYRVKLYGKQHFMKRLKPALRTDPRHVAALQKEFETGYRLEHPHLVRYVARGEDYLLTEYVDGDTLAQFAQSHPAYFRNRRNADRLIRQLLDVVDYLHSHQVVHLDLKPQNILITRIGHDVKLADLGYCYSDIYSDTMGRTDRYAAPEQADGRPVDARTDIFAIGRILQELPCAHLYRKVAERCTADNPKDRFQTVGELLRCLDVRRRVWHWMLAALLTAVLALWLWHYVTERNVYLDPPAAPGDSLVQIRATQSVTTIAARDRQSETAPLQQEKTSGQRQTLPLEKETAQEQTGTVTDLSVPIPADAEDTLRLRREVLAVQSPVFEKMMGHYRDSIYDHLVGKNLERFAHLDIDFDQALAPLYRDFLKSHVDRYSERLISEEWCQTKMMLIYELFWQMKRNAPDHDPFYDNKHFRYYEYPCE